MPSEDLRRFYAFPVALENGSNHLKEAAVQRLHSWRRLLPIGALVLLAGGCEVFGEDISGGNKNATSWPLTITLTNSASASSDPIHLLGPSEDFGPNNRVYPGSTRSIVVTMRQDEEATFQAGRDGTILSTKKCKCTTACPFDDASANVPGHPIVEWNGSSLSCKAF